MKREELNNHYYYEDTVMTPANHLHRVYHADEVDHLLDEKDAEIEKWKMDAGMRERRLKRALWLARAKSAENAVTSWCRECMERWNSVERKCRKKAEQYR